MGFFTNLKGNVTAAKLQEKHAPEVCSVLSVPKSPSPVLSTLQFTFCQCTWVSFQMRSAKGEGEGWCTPEACSNLRPDLEETWIPCLWGSLESLMPCNPMKESYVDIPHKQRHQAHLKLYFLFKEKRIPLGQSIFLFFIPPAMCMRNCFLYFVRYQRGKTCHFRKCFTRFQKAFFFFLFKWKKMPQELNPNKKKYIVFY